MSSLTPHPTDVDLSVTETRVLLVGNFSTREFSAAIAEFAAAESWPRVAHVSAAADLLASSEQPPELIFLAQPSPATYRQADIDRLQQCSPLTRQVIVAGTWCEGELRTGNPLHGVIRLYWYEWKSWWEAASRRQDARYCPHWSQPLEHPQSGRWAADKLTLSAPLVTQNVSIDCGDYTVYETLAAGLRAYGIDARWNRAKTAQPLPAPAAGIWDGGQLSERELYQLASFCQAIDGPVVALLDFPRVEHLALAQTAGVSASYAKPYVVEELALAMQCC